MLSALLKPAMTHHAILFNLISLPITTPYIGASDRVYEVELIGTIRAEEALCSKFWHMDCQLDNHGVCNGIKTITCFDGSDVGQSLRLHGHSCIC